MSCPEWSIPRDSGAADAVLPEEVRAHAARCPRCFERALTVDPTLIFRRLPTLPVTGDDVAAMRRAVASMRQTRELEARNHLDRRVLAPPARGWWGWRAAALAAALVLALLGPSLPRMTAPGVDPIAVSIEETAMRAPAVDETAAWLLATLGREPLIDHAEGSGLVQVIQADYPDLDLVVIIDNNPEVESLDV